MKRFMFLCLGWVLVSCVPQANTAPRLHELEVYSNAPALIGLYSYFYGQATTLKLGQEDLVLTDGGATGDFVVSSALLANNQPYILQKLAWLSPPPTRVQRVPLTSDLQLEVGKPVNEVVYFDGNKWFTLVSAAGQGFKSRVVPKERLGGLQGVGNLNREEAEMLAKLIEPRAPVAVTIMPEPRIPLRQANSLSEYLRTTLYIQQTVPTDEASYQAPSEELFWDIFAQGDQAIPSDAAQYYVIANEAQLLSLWNQAYGTQLSVPPLPDVDFRRETLVAVFSGTKATGGFGLDIQEVTLDASNAYIDLLETSPAADAITTQALTQPWLMLRILRGGISAAWFRNPTDGSLYGVAQLQ
jgi:PrcB C-terminal